MDTLNGTSWDILIAGTGLQESLLALALSRSEKKILHVDKNGYYGGAEAALSLQDAEEWVKQVAADEQTHASRSQFHDASITVTPSTSDDDQPKGRRLSFPRAYSLALTPQIIYTRSALLPALVTSRVDSQLEFLAVGSWFVYSPERGTVRDEEQRGGRPSLYRIPDNREEILEDSMLDRRAKQGLMKFLRFLSDYENQPDTWSDFADEPFQSFLKAKFNLSTSVTLPIKALVLSTLPPKNVKTGYAMARIARHLRSIGLFGPGFGAVIPKWGGMAEIAQVGCRAGAVGGGVYVLGNGIQDIESAEDMNDGSPKTSIRLKRDETVMTAELITSPENLAQNDATTPSANAEPYSPTFHSVSIVSSPLASLFPPFAEGGGPSPAVAVVAVPTSSLASEDQDLSTSSEYVYVMVHSSDTGECPEGQSVLYSTVSAPSPPVGHHLLNEAVKALSSAVSDSTEPQVLWTLRYEKSTVRDNKLGKVNGSWMLPPMSADLAFDDDILDTVKEAWKQLIGEGVRDEDFLVFESREGTESLDSVGD